MHGMHGMHGMRYIEAVRGQGKNLRSSGAAVADQLKGLDLAPWRGRRLGLVGMGASANAIRAALGAYWAAGLPATAWLGSELGYAGAASNFDAVIAVSQSGKSTEIVAALNGPVAGYPKLVVTDGPDAPAARLADAALGLALLGDSNVRTIGYTGTLQALFLLADALAGPGQEPAADWDRLADEVDRQLPAAERLAADLLAALSDVRSFDVVGPGAQAGTAAQGALLLREVAKRPASAYETYQYLHGPIEAAGPGLGLLIIGGAREARLAASLAGTGAEILLITDLDDAGLTAARLTATGLTAAGLGAATPGLTVFRVPGGDDVTLATLGILPLQTISGALAEAAGLPDGEFRFHQDDTKVD
jgi:glucosamine--fructose-6-phosphate aminotransferase (isomerizing)